MGTSVGDGRATRGGAGPQPSRRSCVPAGTNQSRASDHGRPLKTEIGTIVQRSYKTRFEKQNKSLWRRRSAPVYRPGCLLALTVPVRDRPLQKGEGPPHRLQNTEAAVPILPVGGQNGAAEHQAERVDHGVALAPFD